MIVEGEKECINDDHEEMEEDGPNEAQVTSIVHPISVEYITKYALFHICRKLDFDSEFYEI